MSDRTLGPYAQHWLAAARHRVKPRTLETYAAILEHHILPTLGPTTRLDAITREQIRMVLLEKREQGYATGTIRLILAVMSGLFTSARLDDELLTRNPTERLWRLTPKRRGPLAAKDLPAVHLERLLRAAAVRRPQLHPLFFVAARTGLRIGEALALRWEDVALDRRSLTVARTIDWRRRETTTKGNDRAELPLSRDAVRVLSELRARNDRCVWIFHGPSGRPWSRVHVWRSLRLCCALAGIPPRSAHALRHAFITALAEHGENPWAIRDLARHRSITTTEQYLHLSRRYLPLVDRLDRGR